jgi:hypothetical protein
MPLFRQDKTLEPVFGQSSSLKKALITNFAGDGITTYNVGAGGSVARGNLRLRANAGTDTTGYGGIRARDWFPNLAPMNNDLTAINFAYPFVISCQFYSANASRGGNNRFYLGGTSSYTVGDNTKKCIGFRVLDETIYAAFHDGTSYSEPASTSANLVNTTTPSNTTIHIRNVGNGTVIWYANGVQFASTSSGPTGASAHVESNLLISSENSVGNTSTYLDYLYIYFDFQ